MEDKESKEKKEKLFNDIKEEYLENKTEDKKEEKDDKKLNPELLNKFKTIKLKTSDDVVIEVEAAILKKSKLILFLVEECQDENSEIKLKEVDSKNLELIIQYLQHYRDMEPKEIPKPFPERTDDEFLRGILNDEWTFNYLQSQSLEGLIHLVNAANFLQIDGLINIIAAKLAHEMCNCEVEEARAKFGIECDMTEEEVAEIDKYPLD